MAAEKPDPSQDDDSILELLPIPACICEARSGVILRCNRPAIALLGRRPRSDTRIHDVLRFVRPDGTALPQENTALAAAVAGGASAANQHAVIERPGEGFVRVTLDIMPLKGTHPTRKAGLLLFHEATPRRRRDVVLAGQKRALEMIARGAPLGDITDTLTGIVEEQADGAAVAAIMLLDSDGAHLRHAGQPGLPGQFQKDIEALTIGRNVGTCHAAASLLCGVITEDIEQAPGWETLKDSALAIGLRAAWSIPIISSSNRVLGTFGTYFRECRGPSADEREIVELLAHTAAIAIERQQGADRLLAADQSKDEFLAMIVHELRSPLAPILAAAQLLGTSDPDTTLPATVRLIVERQVRNMTRLIDDLLDVSRITRGTIEMQMTTTNVVRLIERAIETALPLLQKRQHRLSVVMPDEPIAVCADATRMEQVFVNLLTNAAKYTNTGGHIAIRVAPQGEAAVTVRVFDNGRGISPALLPHVFDMFTQGRHGHHVPDAGLGVGLTIARRIVEMHGGSSAARSDGPGSGSEFTVTLPRSMEVAVDENAPACAPRSLNSQRVLIVEDEQDAANMLTLLLTSHSHEVRVAGDGPAAIAAAAQFHPEVMLIDIGLPGMSGYELAKRIRSDPALAHVLLVAVTGYGGPQDRIRAISSGFDDYLFKPVDPAVLAEVLAEAAQRRLYDGGPAQDRAAGGTDELGGS